MCDSSFGILIEENLDELGVEAVLEIDIKVVQNFGRPLILLRFCELVQTALF